MKKFQFDFGHFEKGIAEGERSSASLHAGATAPRYLHQYVT
jgi:hypothetical protein